MKSNTKKINLILGSILCILTFTSCGTSTYVSTTSTAQISDKFSNTDLRIMSQEIHNSIINRLDVIRRNFDQTPVIALIGIRNNTTEYIDTEDIADKLQINLIQAGSLRFVDRSVLNDMIKQFDLKTTGLMDPNSAKEAGRVMGNDLFLIGDLTSIVAQDRRTRETFYRLSMRLIDAETNEIIWADESEVKKQTRRNMVDW